MKISEEGIKLIQDFERCELEAYFCPAGVLTIGYGHTGNVTKGMKITENQAEELLGKDLSKFEKVVEETVKIAIKQNQFDALVSFCYNVGGAALKKSTLIQLLNQGNIEGASLEFLKWNKGGGKVLPGLTRRRENEKTMFDENKNSDSPH